MGGGYINKSGNYRFEELGIVHVNVRSTSKTVRARWKAGQMYVSAPTSIAYDTLLDILRGFQPKMEEARPDSPYYLGQQLDFSDLKVSILPQNHAPDRIFTTYKEGEGSITIGNQWKLDEPGTIQTISKALCRMAQIVAPKALIPRAKEIADEIGKYPLSWQISNGHRVLGRCDSRGVVSLSYALVFYPLHLRDYVVCHELAHLSEMNHSPRFHEICDNYCHGQEAKLVAELNSFRPPIIR